MSIRLSNPRGSGKIGRQPPVVMIGCVVLAILSALVGLWFVFGRDDGREAPSVSAEGEKLSARGAAKSAELRAAASALQQKAVGEGYEFDLDGRLIGATADDSDLPGNRTLAQLTGDVRSDPQAEIRAGVRHRIVGPEAAVGPPGELGGSGRAGREPADRGLLTQSMLAYSTVGSAGWAERRPDSGRRTEVTTQSAMVDEDVRERQEQQSDDRMVTMMERLQDGLLTGAVSGAGPAGKPRTETQPALYPATSSPQAFARGAVGDMRIASGSEVIVRQGKFLDCVLVNELGVDLAESPVIAMVSRNFLSGDGVQVVVPAGAKLLGTAGTVQSVQQARVYIKFDRVLFPDQRSAYFPVRQAGAVDGSGAIGVAGDVNRHFLLQFGAAVVLGVLDGLAAAVQGTDSPRAPGARDLVLGQTSSALQTVVGAVLQRYANVVPTVSVPPGTKLKVFFAEDVRMSVYMRASELSWMR
jgi:type IV secretory pathway VirB10-like protein